MMRERLIVVERFDCKIMRVRLFILQTDALDPTDLDKLEYSSYSIPWQLLHITPYYSKESNFNDH